MARGIGEINGQQTFVTVVTVYNAHVDQPNEYIEAAIAHTLNSVRQNPDNCREGEKVVITGYDFIPNNNEIILAVKWQVV